jgi:hypothetical protein
MGLAGKPGGCVIWIEFDEDTLELGPYRWFGGPPGQLLPELSGFHAAKHTKRNAEMVKSERPNIKSIPRTKFERISNLDQLVTKLFGAIPTDLQPKVS